MAQNTHRTGKSTQELEKQSDVEKFEKKVKELEGMTYLSRREAEIYVLYNESEELGMLTEIAEFLEISDNSVYTTWNNIKEKVRKSKATTEMVKP